MLFRTIVSILKLFSPHVLIGEWSSTLGVKNKAEEGGYINFRKNGEGDYEVWSKNGFIRGDFDWKSGRNNSVYIKVKGERSSERVCYNISKQSGYQKLTGHTSRRKSTNDTFWQLPFPLFKN